MNEFPKNNLNTQSAGDEAERKFYRYNLPIVGEKSNNSPVEKVRVIEGKNTRFAYITIEGGHKPNEDVVVYDSSRDMYAVVDGMGGMTDPALSANIVAEELMRGFADDSHDARERTHLRALDRMRKENPNGGACYTLVHINKREYVGWVADVEQSGDTGIVAVNTVNGEIVHGLHQDSGGDLGSAVIAKPREMSQSGRIIMKPSTRLYLASDGLWDNMTIVELNALTASLPIDKSLEVIYEKAMHTMSHKGIGKPDNLSVVIIEKK